jgi:hypothetical protein
MCKWIKMMTNYNSDSAQGRQYDNVADLLNLGTVGDWAFSPEGELSAIWIRTPDGSPNGTMSRLPIAPIDSVQAWWEWDGNRDAPTISPSIHRLPIVGFKAGWHGWMRVGWLESC